MTAPARLVEQIQAAADHTAAALRAVRDADTLRVIERTLHTEHFTLKVICAYPRKKRDKFYCAVVKRGGQQVKTHIASTRLEAARQVGLRVLHNRYQSLCDNILTITEVAA